MFSENAGPTALRLDLVQALSFASSEALVDSTGGKSRSLSALSAVWNGRKGYVALLIRPLDEVSVRRFTYTEPLLSIEELWGAVDEGIAFLEAMGFGMDPPEFLTLPEHVQRSRLEAWDVLRKPAAHSHSRTLPPARRLARPPVETDAAGGGAVLGRVAVVRGDSVPRARLMSQF